MNIASVTFPLFLQLIRILSYDKKKGFCRNSRKLSGSRAFSFFLRPFQSAKKKNLFQQICLVNSREIFFRGLSAKNTKNKDWELLRSSESELRINLEKDREQSFIRNGRRSTRWCFSFHLGKLYFFAEVVEDFQHCTVGIKSNLTL